MSTDTQSAVTAGPPQPLTGVRIVDLGGIGPGPFASMVLADLGAEIIRIHRPQDALQGTTGTGTSAVNPVLDRGKRSVVLDLKSPDGVAAARRLVGTADAVLEGFRPGVAERLGLGPAELLGDNPQLVYGRITGWGQTGPDAHRAGHDMNYIAGSGVLAQLGRAGDAPRFPANLIADFGGGGMQLALGIVAALLRAKTGGPGAVVDATMGDGANLLWSMQFGMEAQGVWREARGQNMLDSGAPFYDVYETADGQHVSVGCIEPQFYAEFVEKLGLSEALGGLAPGAHLKPENWDLQRTVYTEAIAARTQAELEELFAGSDACTIAIRSFAQAEENPHNVARGLFFRDADGHRHPAPAPRFADLGGAVWAGGKAPAAEAVAGAAAGAPAVHGGGEPYVQPGPAPVVGADTDELLASAGLSVDEISALRKATGLD